MEDDNMVKQMCCNEWAPTVLRAALGLLFVIPGVMKLMNPAGIIGMLSNIGFPLPAFWGWLLLASEIVFGTSVLVGFKVRYTVWPLVVIMAVAILTVVLPTATSNPVNLLFHLLTIASLVNLFFSGAGTWAVSKE